MLIAVAAASDVRAADRFGRSLPVRTFASEYGRCFIEVRERDNVVVGTLRCYGDDGTARELWRAELPMGPIRAVVSDWGHVLLVGTEQDSIVVLDKQGRVLSKLSLVQINRLMDPEMPPPRHPQELERAWYQCMVVLFVRGEPERAELRLRDGTVITLSLEDGAVLDNEPAGRVEP